MEEQAPRVSIGLPVYNGEEFLAEAIDSLLAQTYRDFELIISDNASTDRTEEICRKYAAQDPRVRYSRNSENIGGMNNANRTFRLSRGDYFRMAAHDDRCAPTLIERLVAELDKAPEITIACAAAVSIDARGEILAGRVVGTSGCASGLRGSHPLVTDEDGVRYPTEGTARLPHQRFRELILTRGPCEATYGLMRSDVLRQTGLQGSYTGADYVLLCELALRGPFHLIREPLFFKRYHAGNSYDDWRGRMAWARPDLAQSGRLSLPHWLELAGYLRALKRAAVPWNERAHCLLSLGLWIVMMRRRLAGDIIFAAKMMVRSKEWRRARYAPERWL